jgi:hypothetical protein
MADTTQSSRPTSIPIRRFIPALVLFAAMSTVFIGWAIIVWIAGGWTALGFTTSALLFAFVWFAWHYAGRDARSRRRAWAARAVMLVPIVPLLWPATFDPANVKPFIGLGLPNPAAFAIPVNDQRVLHFAVGWVTALIATLIAAPRPEGKAFALDRALPDSGADLDGELPERAKPVADRRFARVASSTVILATVAMGFLTLRSSLIESAYQSYVEVRLETAATALTAAEEEGIFQVVRLRDAEPADLSPIRLRGRLPARMIPDRLGRFSYDELIGMAPQTSVPLILNRADHLPPLLRDLVRLSDGVPPTAADELRRFMSAAEQQLRERADRMVEGDTLRFGDDTTLHWPPGGLPTFERQGEPLPLRVLRPGSDPPALHVAAVTASESAGLVVVSFTAWLGSRGTAMGAAMVFDLDGWALISAFTEDEYASALWAHELFAPDDLQDGPVREWAFPR